MDYAWVVWRGLCKLKEVNKSVMIYFGPHTKNGWVKLLVKKKQGKLNFKIFKGSSNILLPYHFQSHEWLMPNKHCWQSFISFTTVCVCYNKMLHDLRSSNIVQNPFKKHKDVSGWKIRPFANALRNKNLDTCLKSSYIHGSFKNIYTTKYIAFMGLTLFSKTRKNASVFKIFRILLRKTIFFSA